MKKITIAALFITVLVAVSTCGCSFLNGGQSTPTPTPLGPMPSATPHLTPTPESVPAFSKPSGDVKIIAASEDWRVISDQKTRDGRQFENISLAIVNDGSTPAKKIVLSVSIVDELKGVSILSQQFVVGDLGPGGQEVMNLITDPHDPSSYILVTIKTQWGEHGEYYSETPFKRTFSFML